MDILKRIVVLATFVLMMGSSASASVIEFTLGDTNYVAEVEGEIKNGILEAAPFIKEGRTMVPVRAISDAFGAKTDWDDKKREVKISNSDKEILLTIDSLVATLGGEEIKLDASPVIVNGRTFVPLRFVSEELSYNVNYVNTTKQVVIDNTDIVIKCGEEQISMAEAAALYRIMYDSAYPEVLNENVNEDEFELYIAQAVLETLMNNAGVYNAFSSVGLSQTDYNEIKTAIESEGSNINYDLKGMIALIFERQYFSGGRSIVREIMEQEKDNFDERYNEEFISAKHILVEDEKTANDIYEKLLSGEDFDNLVKEFNIDPGMESNPDGYVFTKGDMVIEFEEASYALKEGEISKPVKSNYGYHIIKRTPLPKMNDDMREEMAIAYANRILSSAKEPELLIDVNELVKHMNK